jgi:hypothetical protein
MAASPADRWRVPKQHRSIARCCCCSCFCSVAHCARPAHCSAPRSAAPVASSLQQRGRWPQSRQCGGEQSSGRHPMRRPQTRTAPTILTPLSRQRVILYPAYINSRRTVSQGRRIPSDKGAYLLPRPELEPRMRTAAACNACASRTAAAAAWPGRMLYPPLLHLLLRHPCQPARTPMCWRSWTAYAT